MDSFPLFSRLPVELRRMIWLCTLPEEDVPALVPYDDKEPYESFSDMRDEEELTGEDIADERAFWDEQLGQSASEPAIEGDDDGAQHGGPSSTVRAAARRMLAEAIDDADADDGTTQVGNGAQEGEGFNGNGNRDQGEGSERAEQVLSGNEESEEEASDESEGFETDEEEEEDESEDEDEVNDAHIEGTADQGPKRTLSRPWIPLHLPPLVLVNREARQTMLGYIDGKNWAIIRNKIHKGEIANGFAARDAVFMRRYDPQHDALWVDRLHWPVFLDHLLESESREGADVVTLAVPAFTAYHSVMTLSELFYDMPNLKRVVCIWGELPPDEWVPEQVNGMRVLRRRNDDDDDDGEVQLVLWDRWEAQKVGREAMADGKSKQTAAATEATDWSDLENPEDILLDQTTVRMCVRDPMDRGDTFEEGILGEYMNEIYEVLNAMTVRSGALRGRAESLGSVRFLAREAVYQG
jgi:hypothetical protein